MILQRVRRVALAGSVAVAGGCGGGAAGGEPAGGVRAGVAATLCASLPEVDAVTVWRRDGEVKLLSAGSGGALMGPHLLQARTAFANPDGSSLTILDHTQIDERERLTRDLPSTPLGYLRCDRLAVTPQIAVIEEMLGADLRHYYEEPPKAGGLHVSFTDVPVRNGDREVEVPLSLVPSLPPTHPAYHTIPLGLSYRVIVADPPRIAARPTVQEVAAATDQRQ